MTAEVFDWRFLCTYLRRLRPWRIGSQPVTIPTNQPTHSCVNIKRKRGTRHTAHIASNINCTSLAIARTYARTHARMSRAHTAMHVRGNRNNRTAAGWQTTGTATATATASASRCGFKSTSDLTAEDAPGRLASHPATARVVKSVGRAERRAEKGETNRKQQF